MPVVLARIWVAAVANSMCHVVRMIACSLSVLAVRMSDDVKRVSYGILYNFVSILC
jgi:hypothetical protein